MNQFDNLKDSLNSFLLPENERIEPEKDNDEKMWSYIESAQIHISQNISKPPAIMSIIETDKIIPIFTKGNFSLFKGQAKSRKTFGLSMIAASLGYGIPIYKKFKPDMQGLKTLYIDTEQSDYHVYRFVNSVVNISGYVDQSPNFIAIALRKYETSMRLKLVEFMIYNATDLGYVIIDGIRDLITDINSQDEAKMISDKLLKWTKEKNIHISCVLHENKEGGKARGHIGTELVNKAETVIRFEKNPQDKRQSIISPEDTRGEEFEPICFEIDQNENGLFPVIIEKSIYESKQVTDRF